jgi:NTE family protein
MSRRVGVVLGAGGVLGGAWLAGALVAVQDRLAVPIGEVDLLVGTSVGSILTVALRCGLSVEEIVAHQRGGPVAALPRLDDLDRDAGPRPPRPRMRIGSPRLLATTARAPRRVHPWVAASALAPQGRGQLGSLSALVRAIVEGGFPGPGQTWIMAVDYESGRRVAFGRPGAPPAQLPDAVVASCSIPGWYQPKTIDGRRYVDGGVRSTTSLDQVARAGLDEVYVLAPMASYRMDSPTRAPARLERMLRRVITRGLTADVSRARAAGTEVTVLTPGPEDLAAIGANLMNSARRVRVLDTSLRTSRAALAVAAGDRRVA